MLYYQEITKMVFVVNKNQLQRGRGLSGIFANVLKKIVPFGKAFLKGGLNMGKDFINSETGKSILSDSINSAASAATTALLDKSPKRAKEEIVESLKRSKSKSSNYAKNLAKTKLDKVLTGRGGKKKRRGKKRVKLAKFKSTSLLDV